MNRIHFAKMKNTRTIEEYIKAAGVWKASLELLRQLLLSTELNETIKWGMPVYTLQNKNVAGFSAFKSYVGIWFFQGVYLKDPQKKLINAQEGVTKALRQWRFLSADEILHNKDSILAYLAEAIQNQKEGKEMKPERNKPLNLPRELEKAFLENPNLKDSFNALSLAKRRDYAEHIRSAKKEETKVARLEKIVPMIVEGIGLNDKYTKY